MGMTLGRGGRIKEAAATLNRQAQARRTGHGVGPQHEVMDIAEEHEEDKRHNVCAIEDLYVKQARCLPML